MLGHVTVFLTMPVDPMLARLKVGLHVGSLMFVVYLHGAAARQPSDDPAQSEVPLQRPLSARAILTRVSALWQCTSIATC